MTHEQRVGPPPDSDALGPTSLNGPMKPLNCETTWSERKCQDTLATSARSKSTIRNDVDQISDPRAFDEMYKYIKSDTQTLDKHSGSEVASFYAGRSIFITGASGFVGKVSKINCTLKLEVF